MPFHICFSSYLRLSRLSRRHGKAFPWTRVPSCTTQCGTGGISRRCCFERRRRARSSRTRSCTSRNASGPSARICDLAKIPRSGSPHHPTSWREFNLLFRPGSGRGWVHGMQPSAAGGPVPTIGAKKMHCGMFFGITSVIGINLSDEFSIENVFCVILKPSGKTPAKNCQKQVSV